MATEGKLLAPQAGALFDYNGGKYRVKSWLREAPPRTPSQDPDSIDALIDEILWETAHTSNGTRFQYCVREDATHVSGSGVCGCLVPINAIRVTGMVSWPAEQLEEAHRHAERYAAHGALV